MTETFDQIFSSWVSGPSTSMQAIVADFMDEGLFSTHIRMMRALYKARYEVLMSAAEHLPDSIQIQQTAGGFHTPAFVDGLVDEDLLVEQAQQRDITLVPLNQYCLTPITKKGVVLGFGSTLPEEIEQGVEIIGSLPALRV